MESKNLIESSRITAVEDTPTCKVFIILCTNRKEYSWTKNPSKPPKPLIVLHGMLVIVDSRISKTSGVPSRAADGYLLGTGPHSRRWAEGEQAKISSAAPQHSHYCLNHPPSPTPIATPAPVSGKIVFHKTGPWCQKGWGPQQDTSCSKGKY